MPKKSEKPVTQSQFSTAMKKIDERFASNDKRMDTFATKEDLIKAMRILEDNMDKKMREFFYTKVEQDRFLTHIDNAITEIQKMRLESELIQQQFTRLDDHDRDHEKRIRVLENSPR